MKQMLRGERLISKIRLVVLYVLVLATSFLFAAPNPAQVAPFAFPGTKPTDTPQSWKPLIGEYGPVHPSLVVLEKSGKLVLRELDGTETTLQPASNGNFTLVKPGAPSTVHFFQRRKLGPDEGQVFQIHPSRSIEDLRQEALAASPPHENGQFRAPDLVDLASLDPTIHLDIRYATSNDFLGTPVYTQARAFLQRPAAEALVRALHRLQPYGYALLIHDAYRPWYVTKIFWDATPPEGKIFVADPAVRDQNFLGRDPT